MGSSYLRLSGRIFGKEADLNALLMPSTFGSSAALAPY